MVMRKELQQILSCPRCLGDLTLKAEVLDGREIEEGALYCEECHTHFPIKDGVVIFGIRRKNMRERFVEIDGEGKWASEVGIEAHIEYAKESAWAGEMAVRKIRAKIGEKRGRKARVLDIGAGTGLQSWQFSKNGFESVALELCPDFLFAGARLINSDIFFERVVADCTLLPFKKGSFDVVFCRELLHHIGEPYDLLSEISRVTASNAIVMIIDPCKSILTSSERWRKTDKAADAGVIHYYYKLKDYLDFMGKISSSFDISGKPLQLRSANHPFLSKILKINGLLYQEFSNRRVQLGILFSKIEFGLIGGMIQLMALKTKEYQKDTDRELLPIDLKQVDRQRVAFYKNELIPAVLPLFADAHNKARLHS